MANPTDKQIDDIVSMLDSFMSSNGGHMNISVSQDGKISAEKTMAKTVTTLNSLDCAAGDLACNIPTLFQGLDTDEESPENSRTEMDDTY
ncbi:MAG TPA: hypothetical protein H9740_02195 [Candidatus Hungatella pullicola]|nr:hypothetical protein [Candidatus Hungatella pullicola]